MSNMGRGIVLAILVLIFLTGITLDRFWQTRARMPRGPLRQDSPAWSDGATPDQATRDARQASSPNGASRSAALPTRSRVAMFA